MRLLLFVSSFVIIFQEVISYTGDTECPDKKEIEPCICYFMSGHAYLACRNITDAEVLRGVFIKSQSYEFTVVVIEDSMLEYLPHEVIDGLELRELQLKKTSLQQVFDRKPSSSDTLHALVIDNIRIERGIIWEIMQPMKSLRYLYVIRCPIPTIGKDFSGNVNKNLVALSFYRTKTTTIESGALAEFRKLDKVEVDGGQLEVLTRDIFSTPFNGRLFYFNDQKLKDIPEGLFSQMPNLSVVSFKKNQIATIHEKAFDRDITGKVDIFLNDNPLKCDCLLLWLIQKKPRILQGKCTSPKQLHGKEINALKIHDFDCVLHQGLGETGCPDAEDIQPCVCTTSPFTYLLCKNISDGDELKSVFEKSTRYTYNEVHIEYSVMQYLPANMFETVEVHEIYLKNVTLSNLFNKPPKALDKLRKLHVEDCRLTRGIFWRILEPLKSLKILNVYFNNIKALGDEFSTYAPKGLEQLTFYGTQTKSLKPGVFANFTKLDKIAIDACKLTALTRDIFPKPFNGRYIYFNDNNITEIPAGMFKQMPKLQTLSLRKNQIGILPKDAFDSPDSVAKLQYLVLDDNPLKCDCLLVWLMDVKPSNLQGKCISPKALAGKELRTLQKSNFNCK